MDVTRVNAEAVMTMYLNSFQAGFMGAKPWWQNIAMESFATTHSWRQLFLDQIPKMREWVGGRELINISNSSYVVVPKNFEITLALEQNDLEDDTFGLYAPLAEMIGQQAAMHPCDLMVSLLRNGNSATLPAAKTYDGVPFFGTTHPVSKMDATTQSNYFTSKPLTLDNVVSVRNSMRANLGADVRPFGNISDCTRIICPTTLEGAAKRICNAQLVPTDGTVAAAASSVAATNQWLGTFTYEAHPELDVDPTTWYLGDFSKPIRPLVRINRRPIRMAYKVAPTDDNVFYERKLVYGGDLRDEGGYGMWWMLAKAVA